MNTFECDISYAPAKIAGSNPERFVIVFWNVKDSPMRLTSTESLSKDDFRAKFIQMGHTTMQVDALVAYCSVVRAPFQTV